jgi:hypothetical protein
VKIKNKKESKDYVDIYWSSYGEKNQNFHRMLMDVAPEKMTADLIKNKAISPKIPKVETFQANGYQQCSALHTLSKNMFVIKSPISAKIQFNENGEIIKNTKDSIFFNERASSLKDSFSFDFNFGYLFFTDEENVNITLTPAYIHKTSYRNDAFLAPAKFSISSWLRPVTFIFQMWEESKTFELNQGDAIGYISFDTEKPIRFHQFMVTDDIVDQVSACINYKYFKKFVPMKDLYDLFKRTSLKNVVLKEIKKNVISD